eukprot:CAMPEP_0170922436 /NCGR_PEP_ID=MMETSP0735-20130129/10450_1 /TAXON_ID=186038 /ORGANISM="Fragilariopsis kerguelensis, Strain L26-C5" /LENGTH=39 /DNA_ID= /DNA_START= /DNA_END= /DNA_ORIENTATION=
MEFKSYYGVRETTEFKLENLRSKNDDEIPRGSKKNKVLW